MKRIVLLLLFFALPAFGQTNIRWDSVAATTGGVGTLVPILAMPGSAVAFFNACTTDPCSPTRATTFTSANSTTACPTGAQVVWQLPFNQACTSYADSRGQFGAYFQPGAYEYTISNGGLTLGPYYFTVGGSGGSSGGPIDPTKIGTIFYADGFASPDIAFATASAWVTANNQNALLQWGVGTYRHCTAFTLPTTSNGSTLSMNGAGAVNTVLQQSCSIGVASVGQPLNIANGGNQQPDITNMTIDANGNAPSALEVFGSRRSKIEHLVLKNAAGTDHVFQLGSNATGGGGFEEQVFDVLIQATPFNSSVVLPSISTTTVGGGVGTITISSGGTNLPAATSVLFLDPTCTTQPTGTATVSGGHLTGVTVTNAGTGCTSIFVQAFPTPLQNFGLLIQAVTDSDLYAVRTNGTFNVGTFIAGGSGNNRYYGLHPIQSIIGIHDGGHSNFFGVECDSNYQWCMDFESNNSTVTGLSRTWNNSYPGSGDFLFGSGSKNIKMAGLWCGSSQTAGGYNEFFTPAGNVFSTGLPVGVSLTNNLICDGSGEGKDFNITPVVTAGLQVATDNSPTGEIIVGSGALISNFINVSGGRGTFGYDNSLGNMVFSGGLAKGICLSVNSASFPGVCSTGLTATGIPYGAIGTAIASASTIAPTGQAIFHVTGTTPISTITVPTGCGFTGAGYACSVTFIPDGAWSTVTGGNIAIATTAVVGKALTETFDPATGLWYGSY